MTTRREFLKLTGAASASVALPAIPAALAAAPQFPAFSVGTPGDYNWRVYYAATADRAKAQWAWEYGDERLLDLEVRDVPHLGLAPFEEEHPPSVSDKIAMGWDDNCSRCHADVALECEGYYDIGGECVCTECLTANERDALDHEDFLHYVINEHYDLEDPAIFALLRPEDLADQDMREILSEESALHPECLHLAPFSPLPIQSSVGGAGEG